MRAEGEGSARLTHFRFGMMCTKLTFRAGSDWGLGYIAHVPA
jgi:hypothetical protein